ncbi:hypothetical protein ASD62_14570 [Phycicoccus sp. Root563]|uniref:hypothetical protein n=1 Tax=Phycicoccus sp. Root563 TaxID=1736562 RepID=UPI000703B76A|nr:hypothetical protein [Phycicoccus sp. Root563]KQZ90330.1 hypothetical protein ASD62_14570 [Phycicoccus sp. Root563]
MSHHRGLPTGRLRALVTSHASGALVAQVWQAATSFVLQVVAAHVLGAKGLGLVSLCLGTIVLVTAVTSGFVGDSLTVLDRADSRVRGGLQWWALVLGTAGPALAAAVLWGTGSLDAAEAGLFLLAAALFAVEEVGRRLLMASLRFWRLVVVDSVALATAVAALVVFGLAGTITLGSFLGAVALGQATGLLTVAAMLAPSERWGAPVRGGAVRDVASFGVWRGAQVAVNPGVFTAFRLLVVAVAGAAALGHLEAARILVAPALLMVQGLGSYLLASYGRDRSLALTALVTRARRGSAALVLGALGVGLLIWLAAPLVGPWVTGDGFTVPLLAVAGWACYAAAIASMQPFVSLAAARGRQRAMLGVRLLDAAVSLVALVAWLLADLPTAATPFVLALGPVAAGLVTRFVVLTPMLRTEQSVTTSAPAVHAPAQPREAAHHAR